MTHERATKRQRNSRSDVSSSSEELTTCIPDDIDHWRLDNVTTKSFEDCLAISKTFLAHYKNEPRVYCENKTYWMALELACVLHIDKLVANSGHSREICWNYMRNKRVFRVELPNIARLTIDKCFDRSVWYNTARNDSSTTDIDNNVMKDQMGVCDMDCADELSTEDKTETEQGHGSVLGGNGEEHPSPELAQQSPPRERKCQMTNCHRSGKQLTTLVSVRNHSHQSFTIHIFNRRLCLSPVSETLL